MHPVQGEDLSSSVSGLSYLGEALFLWKLRQEYLDYLLFSFFAGYVKRNLLEPSHYHVPGVRWWPLLPDY